MKKSMVLFAILIVAISCGQDKKKQESEFVSTITAGSESEAELEQNLKEYEQNEANRIAEIENSSTTLEYDKLQHDFGKLKVGSTNLCQFKVTNTGKQPLIIESVSATCGCTTPRKPEKPIPPGKSDIIEVGFKPNAGQEGETQKTVTVIANTLPKETKIDIKAFVIK